MSEVNDSREPGENPVPPAASGLGPSAGAEPVAGRRRGPRRAVRRGAERETVSGVSSDERPDGWGEARESREGSGAAGAGGERPASGGEFGSNDERLRQDVPPHW